jgi:hypothetical protein
MEPSSSANVPIGECGKPTRHGIIQRNDTWWEAWAVYPASTNFDLINAGWSASFEPETGWRYDHPILRETKTRILVRQTFGFFKSTYVKDGLAQWEEGEETVRQNEYDEEDMSWMKGGCTIARLITKD